MKEKNLLRKALLILFVVLSLTVDVFYVHSVIVNKCFNELLGYYWLLLLVVTLTVLLCCMAKLNLKVKVKYMLSLTFAFSLSMFNLFAHAQVIKKILNLQSVKLWVTGLQVLAFMYFIIQIMMIGVLTGKIVSVLMKKYKVKY